MGQRGIRPPALLVRPVHRPAGVSVAASTAPLTQYRFLFVRVRICSRHSNLPVRQPLQAINPEVTRRLQEFAFDQDEVTEVLERVRMNEERKRRKNGVLLAALPPSPRARERAWMRG